MTDFDFSAWMPLQLERVERALEAWVSTQGDEGADHHAPAALVDAMRVEHNSKRIAISGCR